MQSWQCLADVLHNTERPAEPSTLGSKSVCWGNRKLSDYTHAFTPNLDHLGIAERKQGTKRESERGVRRGPGPSSLQMKIHLDFRQHPGPQISEGGGKPGTSK